VKKLILDVGLVVAGADVGWNRPLFVRPALSCTGEILATNGELKSDE